MSGALGCPKSMSEWVSKRCSNVSPASWSHKKMTDERLKALSDIDRWLGNVIHFEQRLEKMYADPTCPRGAIEAIESALLQDRASLKLARLRLARLSEGSESTQ